MMTLWSGFVDTLGAALGVATQCFGGNLGAGIVALTLVVRAALLPVTYAAARHAHRRAALLKALEPELRRLRERYRTDSPHLVAEHGALLRRHGLATVDARGLLRGLAQTPFVLGMYAAVRRALAAAAGGRFLWIPNITRPDAALAFLVAALTMAMVALAPHARGQSVRVLVVLPAALSVIVLLKLSAGYGLYWGASSLVGTVQALMLRRHRRRSGC